MRDGIFSRNLHRGSLAFLSASDSNPNPRRDIRVGGVISRRENYRPPALAFSARTRGTAASAIIILISMVFNKGVHPATRFAGRPTLHSLPYGSARTN